MYSDPSEFTGSNFRSPQTFECSESAVEMVHCLQWDKTSFHMLRSIPHLTIHISLRLFAYTPFIYVKFRRAPGEGCFFETYCGHSWFLNSFDPQFDAQIYNHSHERILYCFHHESDIHSGIVLISVFPVNMYFFPFFILFSYITILHLNHSLPSFHSCIKSTSLLPQFHYYSVSLQKWADIPGISTEYGIASYSRLATIPHIRAVRDNPIGRKGFKEQVKAPELSPTYTVRSSRRISSYIAITCTLRPKLKPIEGLLLSVHSLWPSISHA